VTTAAHEPFTAVLRRDEGRTIIELHGELDAATAGRVDAYLDDALQAGERRVVIDLQHVAFIDSAGIGAIVRSLKRVRAADGELSLRSPSVVAQHALEISGVSELVAIVTDPVFHSHFHHQDPLTPDE
jgi:anti-anti-sigma factor